jgi:predicted MPP superfamily phosphohydrolase
MGGWLSRRLFLKALLGSAAALVGSGAYALGIEPAFRLRVQRYALTPARWPERLRVSIAVVADIHAGEPHMPLSRIEEVVATTNALGADLVVLLGDYVAGHRFMSRELRMPEVAGALAHLKAPLGVFSILGNHDWWDDPVAQRERKGPIVARQALEKAGVPVLENDAVRIETDGGPFWLLGLGDQMAFKRKGGFDGLDDLPGLLAKAGDDAPAILLAHEPDIFPNVPERVALTLSGHTHGGQVRLLGYSPVVPSRYGNRYAYGHVVEAGRHLIVSGGLGTSILPLRLGVPPEIVLLELGAAQAVT